MNDLLISLTKENTLVGLSGLQRTMQQISIENKNFECRICDKKFRKKCSFLAHKNCSQQN
jgi:hypothetical protein